MAELLGITEREVQDATEGLVALGFIAQGPPRREVEESGYRQVQCDFQWPDGQYCNSTVHFYALSTEPAQHGNRHIAASLAGYCSLEHANAVERPPLAMAQQMVARALRTAQSGKPCRCGRCNPFFDFILIGKLVDAYPDPISVEDAHSNILASVSPEGLSADDMRVFDEVLPAELADRKPSWAQMGQRLGITRSRCGSTCSCSPTPAGGTGRCCPTSYGSTTP